MLAQRDKALASLTSKLNALYAAAMIYSEKCNQRFK